MVVDIDNNGEYNASISIKSVAK